MGEDSKIQDQGPSILEIDVKKTKKKVKKVAIAKFEEPQERPLWQKIGVILVIAIGVKLFLMNNRPTKAAKPSTVNSAEVTEVESN